MEKVTPDAKISKSTTSSSLTSSSSASEARKGRGCNLLDRFDEAAHAGESALEGGSTTCMDDQHLGYDDEPYLISPYVASFWHYILIATCLFDDVIPEYFVCYFIPIS